MESSKNRAVNIRLILGLTLGIPALIILLVLLAAIVRRLLSSSPPGHPPNEAVSAAGDGDGLRELGSSEDEREDETGDVEHVDDPVLLTDTAEGGAVHRRTAESQTLSVQKQQQQQNGKGEGRGKTEDETGGKGVVVEEGELVDAELRS